MGFEGSNLVYAGNDNLDYHVCNNAEEGDLPNIPRPTPIIIFWLKLIQFPIIFAGHLGSFSELADEHDLVIEIFNFVPNLLQFWFSIAADQTSPLMKINRISSLKLSFYLCRLFLFVEGLSARLLNILPLNLDWYILFICLILIENIRWQYPIISFPFFLLLSLTLLWWGVRTFFAKNLKIIPLAEFTAWDVSKLGKLPPHLLTFFLSYREPLRWRNSLRIR